MPRTLQFSFTRAGLLLVAAPAALVLGAPVQLSQQLLSHWHSSAVDTSGVRHEAKDYPKGHLPWMDDAIKKVAPEYPKWDRMRHHGGFGLYRVTVDAKSGTVTTVKIIESTGVPTLDESAMKAVRQWVWSPGKWKEIDIPIAFLPSMR
jgi:TonB family protein